MYLTYSSHCIFYGHVYPISSHWFIKIIRSPVQHFTYLQIPDKFQKAILEWKFTPKYSSTSTAETEKQKKQFAARENHLNQTYHQTLHFLRFDVRGFRNVFFWNFPVFL